MSKTKFTPGPWKVSDHYWVNGPDGGNICKTEYADGIAAKHREGSARLIAAAPEMYAALELAQKWLGNCMPVVDLGGPYPLPLIAAALAKARGEA